MSSFKNIRIKKEKTIEEIDNKSTLNSTNNEPTHKLINKSNDNKSINNKLIDKELNNKKSTINKSITEQSNNDNQINLNDDQQSKTKSIDNLLCKDQWIFKFDWNFREELIKLLSEYTKLLITNGILIDKKELLEKNKDDLFKLLNKPPLKLDEESKFYEICINFDYNFKNKIIDQLIKNENLIYYKNKIDKNLKRKLIEENNHLIKEIISLEAQYLNSDVILVEDEELKFSQSKFKDEKLKNKLKTEFSNLQNDKIDDLKEEINKLKRKLDDEIIKNKKIKIQSNQNNSIELNCVKKDMKNKEINTDQCDNSFGNQLNEPHNKETKSNEKDNLSNNEQTDDARLPLNIENNSLNDKFDTFRENASLDETEENKDCININITKQMFKEAKNKLIGSKKFSYEFIKMRPQLLYLSIYLNQFYRTIIKKKDNKIMPPRYQKKIDCEDLRKQIPKKINHFPINLTPIEVGRVVCYTFVDAINKRIGIDKERRYFYLYLCGVDDLDDSNNSADDIQLMDIITHDDDDHNSSSDNSFGDQLNEPHNKEIQSNEKDNLSNNNEETVDPQLLLNIKDNSSDDDFDIFRENASLDQIKVEQLDDEENRNNCININISNQMFKEAKNKLIGSKKFSYEFIKMRPQLLYMSIYLNQFYRTVIKKKDNKIMQPRYQKKIKCEDLRKQIPTQINHLSINLTPEEVGQVVKYTFADVINRPITVDNEQRYYYLYLCRVDDLDDVNNTDNSGDDV